MNCGQGRSCYAATVLQGRRWQSKGTAKELDDGVGEVNLRHRQSSIKLERQRNERRHSLGEGSTNISAANPCHVGHCVSYLAETPYACKEKIRNLLGYMLSIEGDDESSPFYSVCFLLPMLCQITMETDGCKLLTLLEGHKAIVECLMKMIGKDGAMVENYGTILLACETILNILLKKKKLQVHLEEFQLVHFLQALAFWAEKNNDPTNIMMASCICALIFDLTSEESLLSHSNLDRRTLESLSQLIAKSFSQGELSYDVGEHLDLHGIVASGYSRWADRFPLVTSAVEHAFNV